MALVDIIREREWEVSRNLEAALGECYEVRYDACESGMTFIYFTDPKSGNKYLIHKVMNSEMVPNLNVGDYSIPSEIGMAIFYGVSYEIIVKEIEKSWK